MKFIILSLIIFHKFVYTYASSASENDFFEYQSVVHLKTPNHNATGMLLTPRTVLTVAHLPILHDTIFTVYNYCSAKIFEGEAECIAVYENFTGKCDIETSDLMLIKFPHAVVNRENFINPTLEVLGEQEGYLDLLAYRFHNHKKLLVSTINSEKSDAIVGLHAFSFTCPNYSTPGDSGGPIFKNRKCIGSIVSRCYLQGLKNEPVTIQQHFIQKDIDWIHQTIYEDFENFSNFLAKESSYKGLPGEKIIEKYIGQAKKIINPHVKACLMLHLFNLGSKYESLYLQHCAFLNLVKILYSTKTSEMTALTGAQWLYEFSYRLVSIDLFQSVFQKTTGIHRENIGRLILDSYLLPCLEKEKINKSLKSYSVMGGILFFSLNIRKIEEFTIDLCNRGYCFFAFECVYNYWEYHKDYPKLVPEAIMQGLIASCDQGVYQKGYHVLKSIFDESDRNLEEKLEFVKILSNNYQGMFAEIFINYLFSETNNTPIYYRYITIKLLENDDNLYRIAAPICYKYVNKIGYDNFIRILFNKTEKHYSSCRILKECKKIKRRFGLSRSI